MKNIKVLMLIVALSFTTLFYSCSENDPLSSSEIDLSYIVSSYLTKDVTDSLIATGEIPSQIDGFQIVEKFYGNYYQNEGGFDNNTNKNTYAYSYHKINGKSEYAKNAKIESISMENTTGYPLRQGYFWENGDGPAYSSTTHWEFTIGNETVYDTIDVPSNFGELSFSNDSLDLNEGITLTWNGDSGKIKMYVSCILIDTITKEILDPIYIKPFITEDDGSYTFTPELLKEWGIYQNNSVHSFIVNLHRWNLKFKGYDNGRKILVSVAEVKCNAICRVK